MPDNLLWWRMWQYDNGWKAHQAFFDASPETLTKGDAWLVLNDKDLEDECESVQNRKLLDSTRMIPLSFVSGLLYTAILSAIFYS